MVEVSSSSELFLIIVPSSEETFAVSDTYFPFATLTRYRVLQF